VLLLTAPSSSKHATIAPTIGLGSIGLRGEF
jgi:hypothetical protein